MRDQSLDVAVTGVHARLPGPEDTEKWWAAVCAGEVLTSRVDLRELEAAGVPRRVLESASYVPVRGRIPDSERFDAELFGISPREAELMDPQHRLMLEASWAALEDAGRSPLVDTLRTAVFASSSTSKYMARILGNPEEVSSDAMEALTVGTGRDFMASRVAYKLGLQGPAVSVLTACSSSLVAVHLAVQALNNGDCDQAVVVAASVGFPQGGYTYVRGGIMAADGRCRPFDAQAGGTVGGSGVVAVVLRRLEEAAADAPAYGVIIGSAVNNDGSSKAGFSAPSAAGQAAAIQAALQAGDVPADSLGYIETHGTGTFIGDPIEWTSTSKALRAAGAGDARIAVGAVKANIGHLDAAAGLASLFKALQVVGRGQVPPVANFGALNPHLVDIDSPLYVPTQTQEWRGPEPRRAGISSFGIGGTNAHVVIEASPTPAQPLPSAADRTPVVLLSAVRPEALERSAAGLAEHLQGHELAVADVAHTLSVGRAPLRERLAVTGSTRGEIAEALRGDGRQAVRGRVPLTGARPLVFVLPGQGSQRPGMALPFRERLPGFDTAMRECLDAMEPALAQAVRSALLDRDFPASRLQQTDLAQPALFTVEYAAVRALAGVGLRPVALAGHSLGEVTAACLAGVMDLRTAIEFVALRARSMHDCPPGAMLAVACSEDGARALMREADTTGAVGLGIAAVNGPENCVISGPVDAVDAFAQLIRDRVVSRRLHTAHAFHSAAMEPAAAALRACLPSGAAGVSLLPFVTNVDGSVVPQGTEVPLTRFADSVRAPVRFGDGLAALLAVFPDALAVEAGPGQALSAMAVATGMDAMALSPGKDPRPGDEFAMALATLWSQGQPLDPAVLVPAGRRLHLPGTVFGGARHIAPETKWPAAGAAPVPEPGAPAVPTPESAPAAEAGSGAAPVPAEEVAAAWRDLLGHTHLAEDAGFVDSGGDSLLLIRMARSLEQTFALEIPLRELMLAQSFGDQVRLVERLVKSSSPEVSDE
ncbi:acyltransferase domain-containing protein [Streptomyces sp. NBC_01102]|uniref:type I polyketide synthase n=1 Tax=unclassified Streptomyces TaxID=2593676 RepID=UPI003868C0FB|nr:acyltransferase domain-containing protein [Streptomyces sp. NBC_01102]